MSPFLAATVAPGILSAASLPVILADLESPAGGAGLFALIFFLVFLNGFFVAAEFALVKVRPAQLEGLAEEGDRRAKLAQVVTNNVDSFLSATQLGITLASIGLGVAVAPLCERLLAPLFFRLGLDSEVVVQILSYGIAIGFVTCLHVVLGELIPKSLAIRRAVPTALVVARPLQVFHWFFQPAIWAFNLTAGRLLKWVFRVDPVTESDVSHTAEELAILVNESERSDEVTEIEKAILINALELNDLETREIMLPRNKVVVLDINASFEENFDKAVECQHTRIPLVDQHLDHALGLIHVKDLMRLSRQDEPDLKSIARKLIHVPQKMNADELLQQFLANRAHMALVIDEYGGSLGIVTLDNVVEELVGDIHDEFDEADAAADAKAFVRLSEDEFEVEGALPLHELAEHSDLDLDDPEVATVGGYVTHLLGHLPQSGEETSIKSYAVTVVAADDRVVHKLRFKKLDSTTDDESGAGDGTSAISSSSEPAAA